MLTFKIILAGIGVLFYGTLCDWWAAILVGHHFIYGKAQLAIDSTDFFSFKLVFDEPQEKNNAKTREKSDGDTRNKLENGKDQHEIKGGNEIRQDKASPRNTNGENSNSSSKISSRDVSIMEDRISKPLDVKELESSLMAAKVESPMLSQPQNELSIVNNRSPQNDDNLTMDDVRAVADGMQKILAAGRSQRGRRAHDQEDADHNIDHIRNLIDNLDDEVVI